MKKILMLSLLLMLVACSKVPVGFLKTEDATYKPNKIYAYHTPEEGEPWSKGAPYSSTEIQGLAGTQPIKYEFHSVKATDGGDEQAFLNVVKDGGFYMRGSYIQLKPEAAKQLPYGTYTLSLKVYNEDHSAILTDIFSFVVKDMYEEGDNQE